MCSIHMRRKICGIECCIGDPPPFTIFIKYAFLIAYLPEGLPVTNVSSPYTIIPKRNLHSTSHIEVIFKFASASDTRVLVCLSFCLK